MGGAICVLARSSHSRHTYFSLFFRPISRPKPRPVSRPKPRPVYRPSDNDYDDSDSDNIRGRSGNYGRKGGSRKIYGRGQNGKPRGGGDYNNNYRGSGDYDYRSSGGHYGGGRDSGRDSGRHDGGHGGRDNGRYGGERGDYGGGHNYDSGRDYGSGSGGYKSGGGGGGSGKYYKNNYNNYNRQNGYPFQGSYPSGVNFGAPMGGNFGAPTGGNFGVPIQPPPNFPPTFGKQPLPWMAQPQYPPPFSAGMGGQLINGKGPVGGIPVYPLNKQSFGSQTLGGKPFWSQRFGVKQPLWQKPFSGNQPVMSGGMHVRPMMNGGMQIRPMMNGGMQMRPVMNGGMQMRPVIMGKPVTLGKPNVGVSSLGKAFIPVIRKNPQLSKMFGQGSSGYLQFNPLAQGQPAVMNDYGMSPMNWGSGMSPVGTGMMNWGTGMMGGGMGTMNNMGGTGMMMQPVMMGSSGGGLSKVRHDLTYDPYPVSGTVGGRCLVSDETSTC